MKHDSRQGSKEVEARKPRAYTQFASQVATEIRRHGLLRGGETVICAVSGGADSLALLGVFLELRTAFGFELEVAHVDHQIEEARSNEAAAAVEHLARSLELPFHLLTVDVPLEAHTRRLSLEAAGHEVRRSWFADLCARSAFHRVATAHTTDDQAETVLLHLLRGSGLRGLGGIHPWQPHPLGDFPGLIRPLLGLPRQATHAYAHTLGWNLVEDPTNHDTQYARNHVRHDLLPLLQEQFNPQVSSALNRLAQAARQDEDLLRTLGQQALAQHGLPTSEGLYLQASLSQEHPAVRTRCWQAAVAALGGRPEELSSERLAQLDAYLTGPAHRRLQVTSKLWLLSERGRVYLGPPVTGAVASTPRLQVGVPSRTHLKSSGGYTVSLRLMHDEDAQRTGSSPTRANTWRADPPLPRHAEATQTKEASRGSKVWRCRLDAERVLEGGALYLRTRQPGDVWQPLGHLGERKLKVSLYAAGLPVRLRDQVPILVQVTPGSDPANERLVAVCGLAPDARFAACPTAMSWVELEVYLDLPGESPPTIFKANDDRA